MVRTDGYLAEGSGENLFVVRDEKLYTAPTGLSILPGITRDGAITLGRERGYEVIEKRLPIVDRVAARCVGILARSSGLH